MTYLVTIANAKGGVAKTTTAISLGAALAEHDRRVLVVDLDPQANLTLALGFKPVDLPSTVADVLMGSESLQNIICETKVENLHLAPSNHEQLMAERFLSVRENYELILAKALKGVEGYDYILMDCPPTLGALTHCAMAAANLLIIPTQPEFFSAHALRDMLNLIRAIRQRSNPELRYRLVLTMLDRRNGVHRSLHEQIRMAFSEALFETYIETDTRLRESPAFGVPITLYAPTSRGSDQYRELAQELRQYAHEFERSIT
jgi:chromosome partitioning protein